MMRLYNGQSNVMCVRRATTCQLTHVVQVRQATEVAEYRAAAYLRATSFYKYATDRSQYAARIHQRMKADAEWAAIEAKVSGTDNDFKDLIVSCYIATTHTDEPATMAKDGTDHLEPATLLPANNSTTPERVVGTLDLNLGLKLPSEELIGQQPHQCQKKQRAYLSNVCTAKAAQRKGVAAQLIQAAEAEASKQGVQYLYVHVAQENTAAVQLYCTRCGFHQEKKESEAVARGLSRPSRLLLCKQLI